MVKHLPANADPWVRKIPWRRKWQPTPMFLPGKSRRPRGPVGCSPWGRKEPDQRLNNGLVCCSLPSRASPGHHSQEGASEKETMLSL